MALAAAIAAGVALEGCAGFGEPPPAASIQRAGWLAVEGLEYDTTWTLPAAEATGLVLLQHGFARRCAHLAGLAAAIAAAGPAVLCLDADMAGGNPRLAEALAGLVASGALRLPGGAAAPARVAVAGHSAGGLFALHLGAALARAAPDRLAGALLLDPVAVPGRGPVMAEAARTVLGGGTRPVLAIVAPPSACNAAGNARAPLAAAGAEVRDLGPGATHVDAEGGDTSALAVAACREGPPRPDRVEALRAGAAAWAGALFVRAPQP
jgi:hypothetical protein